MVQTTVAFTPITTVMVSGLNPTEGGTEAPDTICTLEMPVVEDAVEVEVELKLLELLGVVVVVVVVGLLDVETR